MLGLTVSDPALFWAAVAGIGTMIAVVVAIYYGKKSKRSSNDREAISQEQFLGDNSAGYQAGGDINVTQEERHRRTKSKDRR